MPPSDQGAGKLKIDVKKPRRVKKKTFLMDHFPSLNNE